MQKRAFSIHAVDVLSVLLGEEVPSTSQAASVWAIGAICAGSAEIQNSIRTRSEGAVLSRIVQLLDSSMPQVWQSAL